MDDDWLTRMIDDAHARERAEAEAHDAKGGNDDAGDGYSARVKDEEEEEDDDTFEYEPNAYAGGDLTESEEGDMLGTSPPYAGSTGRGGGGEDGEVFADACGSPAVVLVGFRAEEWPRVRTLIDELGGYDVPVIPARSEHAWMTLEEVTREREPDWESPRTNTSSASNAARGGEYGSQRMLAFSGLDLGEVAVVVSAIESQGLPRLPVVIANEENLQKPLGESLALAIRAHRRDARRRRRRGSTVREDDDGGDEKVKDETPTLRQAEPVVVPEVLTTTPSALDARAESERRAASARASAVAAVSEPSHARDVDENDDDVDENDENDDDTDTTDETPLSSPSTGVVTKSQLRELAHRRGLDYDVLIADARAKGVVLPE